ncbi:MAG: Oligopeptidase A [Flavobacteriaceae bacterium]|nr:MAG: Oligopeptidase A [Flavobacteriaceae bacterium]
MNNPLLLPFETPYQAAPFSKIKPEHFLPAIEESIRLAKEELEELLSQPQTPTFQNTFPPLDTLGESLNRNTSLLFNLNASETTEGIQKAAQLAAPLVTDFQNALRLDSRLFDRIKFVYENTDRSTLNAEEQTLLEKKYKGFTRNGALLTEAGKKRLRSIDSTLAKHSLSFGKHVLADTQAYFLHLTQEEDLKGLPKQVIEAAGIMAQHKDLEGWVFTLDFPSYVPFITYAENRSLRKKMVLAHGKRGFQNNKNNTISLIIEIIKLRKERAELLGYSSHASYAMEERMAESEERVHSFLSLLYDKAAPAANKEWNALEQLAQTQLEGEPIQKWDTAFLTEKLKQKQLDLDEQELKPYFELTQVLKGLFAIVGQLYGLNFSFSKKIEGYHPDVQSYEVTNDKGAFVSLLYMDFFPRSGKRGGAWMTTYLSQNKKRRPHVSVVCNFTPPTKTTPSLLSFQEVTTLFHEFGHALHGMLANTTYASLSGTNVYWDFVELPSQLMENWCFEKAALEKFARHYQTGKTLPENLIVKLKKKAQFQQGLQTLRQLSFALLDLSFHNDKANEIEDVKDHEMKVMAPFQRTPSIPENIICTAFSHIFQGGYAAGYYSYKWAEVLDADAFEYFKEQGILNPKIAKEFASSILSKGGTEHPMKLYKRFRGKEPNIEALLNRSGLINA